MLKKVQKTLKFKEKTFDTRLSAWYYIKGKPLKMGFFKVQ